MSGSRGRLARLALGSAALLLSSFGTPDPAEAQFELARRAGDVRDEAAEKQIRDRARLRMARTRSLASLDFDGREVLLHTGKVTSNSRDWAALEELKPGEVQVLTEAAATKLRTEVDLVFEGLVLETGNVADGYAGVYSLWLRRTAEGWSLLVNQEPDIWGTQRVASSDLGEIPLELETLKEGPDELTAVLDRADEGHWLRLRWGLNQWSASFRVRD